MQTASCLTRAVFGIVTAVALATAPALAQGTPCPITKARPATPASTAYAQGNYTEAEELYAQAMAQQQPHDAELAAELVRTQLREGKIAQASSVANTAVKEQPHSAVALTALAEVQLRQGQPWVAMETLRAAAEADPCYARIHLIRSRVFRIDSMYSSERREVQSAYEIDPSDVDIRRAWQRSVSPANDIESMMQSLGAATKPDAETQKLAETSIHSLTSVLSENSQTCQIQPTTASASLPLMPAMQDGKHIDAYQLQAQFAQTRATLKIDTAASGLYISRALAEANGLKQGEGAPPGTVHADSVHIGPLEFRDCTIGVSEAPFSGRTEGFVGTDLFASYLITLDYVEGKLLLAPLPPKPGSLPGDRSDASELRGYTPVYHKLQYLLVPVSLNNKERGLFVLDSGIRYSAVTADMAHALSPSKSVSTSALQTTSGATFQIYRDSFDFEFGNLVLRNQAHVLQFDTSTMEQSAGLKLGGMLGFDMLHSMTMHLDYRDGLVKFESPHAEVAQAGVVGHPGQAAANVPITTVCSHIEDADLSTDSTVQVLSNGLWDSGHMKPGEAIDAKVRGEWVAPGCRLAEGASVYGHVTAVSKSGGNAQLAMVFDHGDCFGQGRKELRFKMIGLYAASGEFNAEHNAVPTEVSGGTRQISTVVANMGDARDQNLNPAGPIHTVHPGIVVGIPKLRLEPEGGPACSTLLTSEGRSVRVGSGTAVLLVLEQAAP